MWSDQSSLQALGVGAMMSSGYGVLIDTGVCFTHRALKAKFRGEQRLAQIDCPVNATVPQ